MLVGWIGMEVEAMRGAVRGAEGECACVGAIEAGHFVRRGVDCRPKGRAAQAARAAELQNRRAAELQSCRELAHSTPLLPFPWIVQLQ